MTNTRQTASGVSTKQYFFYTRLEEYKKIRWNTMALLCRHPGRFPKSFMPFVRFFRELERENCVFIWVYDHALDQVRIAMREFDRTNPAIMKAFYEVNFRELTSKSGLGVNYAHEFLDAVFTRENINLYYKKEFKWAMSRCLKYMLKTSHRRSEVPR